VSLPLDPTKIDIVHNGLVCLTSPLTINRSEGNLIHELGDSAPARVLLKAIQKHGLSDGHTKEVEFYIGIRDGLENISTPPRLFRIVAGSPSKGSIAVEEAAAPPVGSTIQFYYRRHDAPSVLPDLPEDPSSAFLGALIENSNVVTPHNDVKLTRTTGEQKIFESKFLISSEHGFTLTPRSHKSLSMPLRCTVSGTFGGIHFTLNSR